jgi:hypothetical protein
MTVAEATLIRTEILTAYRASLAGKSYTINTGGTSRSFTRNDSDKLRKELEYWDGIIADLSGTRKRVFIGVGRS